MQRFQLATGFGLFQQRAAQRLQRFHPLAVALAAREHHQAIEQREELAVDQPFVAFQRNVERALVVGQPRQALDGGHLIALPAQHLRRDALKLPKLFDETVPIQILFGLQHIAAARLGRQLAHELLDQVADDALPLGVIAIGGRHVDPEELVRRFMHHQRRAEGAAGAAARANRHVDLPAQQRRPQLRVDAQIDDGENRNHIDRPTVWALHLRRAGRKEQILTRRSRPAPRLRRFWGGGGCLARDGFRGGRRCAGCLSGFGFLAASHKAFGQFDAAGRRLFFLSGQKNAAHSRWSSG